MTACPNSRDGQHHFTYSVGPGTKNEFEPQQYGERVEDTLYKRVEYSVLACACGSVKKQKVAL